jgi:hypothetical protein
MTRLGPDPEQWLPELRAILAAIARALGERSPSASLITALSPHYEHSVPGHRVEIEYFPEGYTDDPARQPEYAVSVTGDRFLASWLLLERDLVAFLRHTMERG